MKRSLGTSSAPRRAPTKQLARSRRSGALVSVVLALALILSARPGAALDVPPLAARVTDQAGVLSSATRGRLEETLRALEARTGAQVAVLVLPSLDGESLEAYSVKVAQTWGLGRKGVDDGVLFLVAKNDRKMRIEVGYGLEARLTDALTRRILDGEVRPRFRQNDFDGGIEAGVDAIASAIEGRPLPAPPPSSSRGKDSDIVARLFMALIFAIVVGVHSTVAVLIPGRMAWFMYFFLMPFYAAFPSFIVPPYGGTVACSAWILAFPLLRLWLKPASADFKTRHPALSGFAGGGGSGSHGGGWSSSGGGGFSGGGGSFGGGGSSGSW